MPVVRASASNPSHRSRWRFLYPISFGVIFLGVAVALLVAGGVLGGRYLPESLSLLFTGMLVPAAALGTAYLIRTKGAGPRRTVLKGIACVLILLAGLWCTIDVYIPLSPVPGLGLVDVGLYISVAVSCALLVVWLFARSALKGVP